LKEIEKQTLKISIMGYDIILVSEIIVYFMYWQSQDLSFSNLGLKPVDITRVFGCEQQSWRFQKFAQKKQRTTV
jgi:hypothetical protein